MPDRIKQVLTAWDAIDGHRTGTAGDGATVDWLTDEIARLGAVPRKETFTFQRLTATNARVEWDATTIDGVPCFDAPPTGPGGLAGRLVPFGDLREPVDIGEIGLLDFEASSAGERALISARRDTQHRGLIAINPGSSDDPALINADAYEAAYGPPVLQVAGVYRPALEAAARSGARVTLTTTLRTESTSASNVGTTITGTDPLFHHPDDRWPDAIDLDKAERACRALVVLGVGLANIA